MSHSSQNQSGLTSTTAPSNKSEASLIGDLQPTAEEVVAALIGHHPRAVAELISSLGPKARASALSEIIGLVASAPPARLRARLPELADALGRRTSRSVNREMDWLINAHGGFNEPSTALQRQIVGHIHRLSAWPLIRLLARRRAASGKNDPE